MKKLSLKSKILLSVALLGGGLAGAHEISLRPDVLVDTFYNWISEPNAPDNPSASLPNSTRTEAIEHYGCDTGSELCAKGSRVSGPGSPTDELKMN